MAMVASSAVASQLNASDTTDAPDAKAPLNSGVEAIAPATETDLATQVPDAVDAQIRTRDEEIVKSLAALGKVAFDRERKEAAKKLGIQVTTLDAIVKEARDAASNRSADPFGDSEPWPVAIDLAQLLDEMAAVFRSVVVMDAPQVDGMTLWTAHTYVVDAFNHSPIAIKNAPEKACAKTLLQTVAAKMAKRPLSAANSSVSALFRAIQNWGCTLFIDEADTFFKENKELHGLVNAGFEKGGSVLRTEMVNDQLLPVSFNVYGPKSIAGIALERHLPDATLSRAIVFVLRRKMEHEKVIRIRDLEPDVFLNIRRKLARFELDYDKALRSARPVMPRELSDRQQDCWEPLFSIAQCAGGDWPARALKSALILSKSAESSVSAGNELLGDIQAIFKLKAVHKLPTKELIELLTADEEKGWATYNFGKPLTPRQLAKLLDPYGIHSKTVRIHDKFTPKGYDRDQFVDAFARYLPAEGKLPQRPPQRNVAPTANCAPGPSDQQDAQGDEALLLSQAIELLNGGGVADTSGGIVDLGADKDTQFDF